MIPPSRSRRSLPLLAATLAVIACQQAPRSPASPAASDPCSDLAYVFFVVAENRDRGQTREEQLEGLGESVHSPFVGQPGQTLATLSRVVDAVYATPTASASEIQDSVLLSCHVNARGQVVLGSGVAEAPAREAPSAR